MINKIEQQNRNIIKLISHEMLILGNLFKSLAKVNTIYTTKNNSFRYNKIKILQDSQEAFQEAFVLPRELRDISLRAG